MSKQDSWDDFRKEWQRYGKMVLDPWVLSLGVAAVILGVSSANQPKGTPEFVSTLLTTLLAIISAVLGARVLKVFEQIAEGGAMAARGHGAVRSLMVLLRSIASLEGRLKTFRDDEDGIKNNPALTRRNYEEASNFCTELQEQTVKAVEDWKDLVPEANLTTLVGEISARKAELEEVRAQLESERQRAASAEAREREAIEKSIVAQAQAAGRLQKEIERLAVQFAGAAEARVGVGGSGVTVKLSDLLRGDAGGTLTLRTGSGVTGDSVSVSGGSGGTRTLTVSTPPRPASARNTPSIASSPEIKPPEPGTPSR